MVLRALELGIVRQNEAIQRVLNPVSFNRTSSLQDTTSAVAFRQTAFLPIILCGPHESSVGKGETTSKPPNFLLWKEN